MFALNSPAHLQTLDGDQSPAKTNRSRLRTGGRAQLAQNGADVELHCMGGDVEMGGNLFIRQTLHHHLEHFPFPKCEVFRRSVGDRIGASPRFVSLLARMSEETLAYETGQIARKRKQSGRSAVGGCS